MGGKIKGLAVIRDRDRAVAILAAAFADYPQLKSAFPDRSRRLAVTEAVLRFQVNLSMRYGGVYALTRECQEVALVLPSSRKKVSRLRLLLAGNEAGRYRQALERLTEQERRTKKEIFSEMGQMESEIAFPSRYLYISYMGVHGDYQKQGKGRRLMEKILAHGERKGLPLVLSTSKPEQVAFFQGLGFQVMGITSSRHFQFINIYIIKS